ncbi:MAG: hypothetical protein ACE5E0_01695 [Terriglobia bacterium]
MKTVRKTLFKAGLGVGVGIAIVLLMDGKTRAKIEDELVKRLDGLREKIGQYQRIFEDAIQEGKVASQAREDHLRKKMAQTQRHGDEPPDYIV